MKMRKKILAGGDVDRPRVGNFKSIIGEINLFYLKKTLCIKADPSTSKAILTNSDESSIELDSYFFSS